MTMTESVLYSNISAPHSIENFLERPAVETLLKESFKKPLTTVVAGAGYGKTQAVLAALRNTDCRMIWMQLLELDNHVARFWERLAYLIKPNDTNLYESLVSFGAQESVAAFDQFLRLFIKTLKPNEKLVFVFDDFHVIHNKTTLNFINLLISSQINNFSIVIVSRKNPDFSLTGMMAKGLMARITEENLRFSKDEMIEYFRNRKLDLSEKMNSDIYNYTGGWVFAIYLVGLAAQKEDFDDRHNLNPFSAAKIDIFDLIEKEIFRTASKKLQDFLVRIAILDLIPTDLLNELADNDLSLIAEMLQISLFIRYESFSDSYRIHNLFKTFLLERKDTLSKEEKNEIYLTAATWHIKQNHKIEAITNYKKCGRYDEVFNVILSVTRYVSKDTADFFIMLIEEAPQEYVETKPVIRVAKARYMFNNNLIDEAKTELLKIQEEFEALPNSKENRSVLGEAYIMLALISIVNQDYKFEELFKMANECLPNGSVLINSKTYIAEGINVCSIKSPAAGELKRHEIALFNTAPNASKVMNGCGYGLECLNAAESALYTGDFKAAEKYAFEAVYRSRQYLQHDVEYMANFVLVRIYTAKGNYAKAIDILSQMKVQLETLQTPRCSSLYDVISGWFYLKIGKVDKIAKWIKYEEETRKTLAPIILGREYLVRSDCLLHEERYYELLAFMEQTDKMYENRGVLFAIIQNKITKAIIYHYMGNHSESIKMLTEAYELSHPNNLIMQFVEYGNKMRTLINSARKNEECKIPKEWLNKIYTKSSTYAKQLSQVVSDYNAENSPNSTNSPKLSKRESEMLLYLSRGMTREEISSTCHLALSTVNGVLKNIYYKLGAYNIADAIRLAKEFQII